MDDCETMTPVYQRIIEKGRGDCWAACIASILETDLDTVPNFVGDAFEKQTNAESLARIWLRERGLFLLHIPLHNNKEWFEVIDFYHLENVYCIISLPSQRFEGGSHAVVSQFQKDPKEGTILKVVHDPNKENTPYEGEIKPKRIWFLVNYNPKIK